MLSPEAWHHRYQQQAGWTAVLRSHLFDQIGLGKGGSTLEVGCGTGAVTADLARRYPVSSFGIDWNHDFLRLAADQDPLTRYACADAHVLPFADTVFDAVLAHMFFLWIAEPENVLAEILRTLRPGGWVLALAEPDYGGRNRFPLKTGEISRPPARAPPRQGAFPRRGREMASFFMKAGLTRVECGVMGGQWRSAEALDGLEEEWRVLRADLEGFVPAAELARFYAADKRARQAGERILYVPTWYAIGQKPG